MPLTLSPSESKDQQQAHIPRMPLASTAITHDECSFGEFASIHKHTHHSK